MRILTVVGTRPEAIKMAPVIKKLQGNAELQVALCVTGHHRSMLDQILDFFELNPDYDLSIMKIGQSLSDITSAILDGMQSVYEDFNPDLMLVHGDTATTFAATLSAFYRNIAVGHVEAGLRTGNLRSPWPEEANRRLTSVLTDLHFAPTDGAKANLVSEGVGRENIYVTGNTVIDALFHVTNVIESDVDKVEMVLMII